MILIGVAFAAEAASTLGNGFGWLVLFFGMLLAGGVAFRGTDAGFTSRALTAR